MNERVKVSFRQNRSWSEQPNPKETWAPEESIELYLIPVVNLNPVLSYPNHCAEHRQYCDWYPLKICCSCCCCCLYRSWLSCLRRGRSWCPRIRFLFFGNKWPPAPSLSANSLSKSLCKCPSASSSRRGLTRETDPAIQWQRIPTPIPIEVNSYIDS